MNLGLHLLDLKSMLIKVNTNPGPDMCRDLQRRISPLYPEEKCQYSLKSTFKKVKSQICKGADPERAAKRGYEQACEYLYIWNKTVRIQHRALTCLSKSLAHILQRELYTMGNTGLLRREAEMTLLQPQLLETRRQELRNSSFWPSSVFKSQLVKEGEDFLLKKAPQKTLRVLYPIRTNPFVVLTRKEAPTGNAPVTNRFPQVGGNQTTETLVVIFDPITGGSA